MVQNQTRHRITLNTAELRSLIGGAAIPYRIADQRIEIAFDPTVSVRALIIAVLDRVDGDLHLVPPDPPEAREFLSRKRPRK